MTGLCIELQCTVPPINDQRQFCAWTYGKHTLQEHNILHYMYMYDMHSKYLQLHCTPVPWFQGVLPFNIIHPPLGFFIHSTPCTIRIRVMHISALINNWMEVFWSVLEILLCWLNKVLVISYMDFAFKYAIIWYKTMDQWIFMSWM